MMFGRKKPDMPTTGDGRTTDPRKIGKAEVTVRRASDSVDWKQTSSLWGGKKKKTPPPPAKKTEQPKPKPKPKWFS